MISPFTPKFQHSDGFDILNSNFNILICPHVLLKFQHFDQLPTLSSHFNSMIDSPLCPQILTFWSIPRFSLKLQHFDPPTLYVLKLQHFDWFQNLNLISVFDEFPLYIQISTFWWIWHFALKLFDSPCFTQISTFWSIPLLHFDQFPNCP